jgi:hypothetical protein
VELPPPCPVQQTVQQAAGVPTIFDRFYLVDGAHHGAQYAYRPLARELVQTGARDFRPALDGFFGTGAPHRQRCTPEAFEQSLRHWAHAVHHTVTRRAYKTTCYAPSARELAVATRETLHEALCDNPCYKSLRKPMTRLTGDIAMLDRRIQDAALGRSGPRWLPWNGKSKSGVA